MSEQRAAFQHYPHIDSLVERLGRQLTEASAIEAAADDVIVNWHWYENDHAEPGSSLFVYGNHIFDLDHPQVETMRTFFTSWEEDTAGQERLVRCEGSVPELPLEADELMCIMSERGEFALLTLWARIHGIPVKSLECPIRVQVAAMQTPEYDSQTRDLLFYYYVARQLPQALNSLHLGQVTPQTCLWALDRMQEYLLGTIGWFRHACVWPDFDFSLDNFLGIHKRLYPGRPFNPMDVAFFKIETVQQMYEPGAPIQYVSHAVNLHRDRYVSRLITADMAESKHVFAAMGSPHYQIASTIGNRYICSS
jgi:hypothetical protein